MLKKLFLPVGMLIVIALSFLYPAPGVMMKGMGLNNLLIVAIFLVCGWQTDVDNLRYDHRMGLIFVAGAVLTLGVAPWLAVGLTRVLRIAELPAIGLIVMSAVPPTLSSGIVMTANAGGNVLLSLSLTIGYNLLGVVTLPLMLTWCLSGDTAVSTQPATMFFNLLALVVQPFFAGFIFQRVFRLRTPSWLGYVPSLCVLLLLLNFFSGSQGVLRSYPLGMLALSGLGSLVLHAVLMALMWFGGRAMRFPLADCKAMIFTGASKTVTITLATLAILGVGEGLAVVPCLVFYFVQMIVDSMLAARMGATMESELGR